MDQVHSISVDLIQSSFFHNLLMDGHKPIATIVIFYQFGKLSDAISLPFEVLSRHGKLTSGKCAPAPAAS